MNTLTKEQWEVVAAARFAEHTNHLNKSIDGQFQYGKWIIATLIAVHGGALIAMSQLDEKAGVVMAISGIYFLIGLMLALLCGFMVWINFDLLEQNYRDWIDPRMMFDPEAWPTEVKNGKWIDITRCLSIALGLSSWGLIAVGAYNAMPAFTS